MRVSRRNIKVARVLHEDDEFVTLEVGKKDSASFHLQQDENLVTVGGDRFFTVLFVHNDGMGGLEAWDPFT